MRESVASFARSLSRRATVPPRHARRAARISCDSDRDDDCAMMMIDRPSIRSIAFVCCVLDLRALPRARARLRDRARARARAADRGPAVARGRRRVRRDGRVVAGHADGRARARADARRRVRLDARARVPVRAARRGGRRRRRALARHGVLHRQLHARTGEPVPIPPHRPQEHLPQGARSRARFFPKTSFVVRVRFREDSVSRACFRRVVRSVAKIRFREHASEESFVRSRRFGFVRLFVRFRRASTRASSCGMWRSRKDHSARTLRTLKTRVAPRGERSSKCDVGVCWRAREDHSAHSQDTTAARYPTTVEHRPPSCSEHRPPLCSSTSTHQPDEASGVDPSAIMLKQLKARRPGPTFEPNAAVLVHGKAGTVLKVTHLDETRASTSPRAPPPRGGSLVSLPHVPRASFASVGAQTRQQRHHERQQRYHERQQRHHERAGQPHTSLAPPPRIGSEERRPTPAGRVVSLPCRPSRTAPSRARHTTCSTRTARSSTACRPR